MAKATVQPGEDDGDKRRGTPLVLVLGEEENITGKTGPEWIETIS